MWEVGELKDQAVMQGSSTDTSGGKMGYSAA